MLGAVREAHDTRVEWLVARIQHDRQVGADLNVVGDGQGTIGVDPVAIVAMLRMLFRAAGSTEPPAVHIVQYDPRSDSSRTQLVRVDF